MKLLIVTQAVDTEDPVLGFFVRWIEEFAKCCEMVTVICLRDGTHSLPTNVRVVSLGKEKRASRIIYLVRFYRYIWCMRNEYDAVFVHMNQEYVLIGGMFWRLLGKRVVMWRNHKMGSLLTRLAVALSNSICHTSPDAFVARYRSAVLMPVGIDTDFFTPASTPAPENSILFLGRLDPVKKVIEFIEALVDIQVPFHADIYGSPTEAESAYSRQVTVHARSLIAKGILAMHSGVTHEQTRELYRAHAIYVNLTPSGSFDKTIGEAMASGCIVVSSNTALRGIIHQTLMVRDDDPIDVARVITAVLSLSAQERAAEAKKLRSYVEQEHSLKLLMMKMRTLL